MRSRCLLPLALVALLGAEARGGAESPLVASVKEGNAGAVRSLLEQRVDVNRPEADGMTALHWAVRANDAGMVALLLQSGARPGAANRYGITPLALAAQNGSAPVVALLLAAGADATATLPEGGSALMIAARTGNPAVIKALAAAGADLNAREGWMGETALHWAAAQNHAAAVQVLVELGAEADVRSRVLSFPEFKWSTAGMVSTALPRGGWTPLMHAARDGALDGARALADAGASLDITDPDGTTALVIAIINAHYDLAAMLLDRGADPNVADSTGTAALYALVDMHTLAPMQGRPAPKLAGQTTPEALLKTLLARGADPNARLTRPMLGRYHGSGDATLGEGSTPFLRAAKAVDVSMMRALLDGGADATLTRQDRTTALILAAGGQPPAALARGPQESAALVIEAVTLCLERGVDIDAFNTSGQTAVHAAAGRGADAVVQWLADRGATLDLPDKQHRTPLDIALGAGGGGRGGRGAPVVHESTAALLRTLLAGAPSAGGNR